MRVVLLSSQSKRVERTPLFEGSKPYFSLRKEQGEGTVDLFPFEIFLFCSMITAKDGPPPSVSRLTFPWDVCYTPY